MGFNNGGLAVDIRGQMNAAIDSITYLSGAALGVDVTGTTDVSVTLPAAQATAWAQGKGLAFSPGDILRLTAPMTLDGQLPLDFNQALIRADKSVFTTGQAVTIDCLTARPSHSWRPSIKGMRVVASVRNEAHTLDGVLIKGNLTNMLGNFDYDISVEGFRDNIKLGAYVFICLWRGTSAYATRYCFDATCGTVAGENISLYGTIANASNAGGTAVGLYTAQPATGGQIEINAVNVSFDYNDCDIYHSAGKLTLQGGHVEDGHTNPMIKVSQADAGIGTAVVLDIDGVYFYPPAGVGGGGGANRPTIISVLSGKPVINVRGGYCATISAPLTELITVASGAYPTIRVKGIHLGPTPGTANTIARISDYTNLALNGTFENAGSSSTGALTGWKRTSVNFFRNSVFGGTLGASQYPTNTTIYGILNSLTFTTGLSSPSGVPTLSYEVTGTSSASGQLGLYFEADAFAVAQGESWSFMANIQAITQTGTTSFVLAIQERDAGGTLINQYNQPLTLTNFRKAYAFHHTVIASNCTKLRCAIYVAYNSGVTLSASYLIDGLVIVPFEAREYALANPVEMLRSDTGTVFPALRYAVDTADQRLGTQCLKITNDGTGTTPLYQTFAISPDMVGSQILMTPWAKDAVGTTGTVYSRFRFYDAQGAILPGSGVGQGTMDGNSTGSTSYVQIMALGIVPQGAASVTAELVQATINGTAYIDSVGIWCI